MCKVQRKLCWFQNPDTIARFVFSCGNTMFSQVDAESMEITQWRFHQVNVERNNGKHLAFATGPAIVCRIHFEQKG